jgi:hypothetical protein
VLAAEGGTVRRAGRAALPSAPAPAGGPAADLLRPVRRPVVPGAGRRCPGVRELRDSVAGHAWRENVRSGVNEDLRSCGAGYGGQANYGPGAEPGNWPDRGAAEERAMTETPAEPITAAQIAYQAWQHDAGVRRAHGGDPSRRGPERRPGAADARELTNDPPRRPGRVCAEAGPARTTTRKEPDATRRTRPDRRRLSPVTLAEAAKIDAAVTAECERIRPTRPDRSRAPLMATTNARCRRRFAQPHSGTLPP